VVATNLEGVWLAMRAEIRAMLADRVLHLEDGRIVAAPAGAADGTQAQPPA